MNGVEDVLNPSPLIRMGIRSRHHNTVSSLLAARRLPTGYLRLVFVEMWGRELA